LAFGLSGSLQSASATVVALILWGLTALLLLACWKIPTIRKWTATVDPQALIALHLVRFVGIYFLILAARGRLPVGFARPAGIGDIIVATGTLALLTVAKLRSSVTEFRI